MAQLAVRLQQRFAFLRHREICDHRCEMDVGQGYLATAEIFGVGNKPFQRGEHARIDRHWSFKQLHRTLDCLPGIMSACHVAGVKPGVAQR